ncbi:MAG: OmpA family protein [Gammaproteobacteria bacterium]
MIIRQISVIFFLSLLLAISGCSSNKTKGGDGGIEGDGIEDGAPIDVGEDDYSSSGLDDDGSVILDPLDDPASDLFVRTIYFDYDSSNIREDSLLIVREHGKYLSSSPERLVRLEGHADERGTREYNLALGEERAKSVREVLLLEGAQEVQIEIVSFGEERPSVEGTDDAALQLNRRVEVVY